MMEIRMARSIKFAGDLAGGAVFKNCGHVYMVTGMGAARLSDGHVLPISMFNRVEVINGTFVEDGHNEGV